MQKSSTINLWPELLFFGTSAWLIWFGWSISPEAYLTAENGLGYALGIVGGTLMALLLLYPLRKNRIYPFRFGAIRYWFHIHMIFGVLGPIVILYHANFKLGSINSSVALFCMLLVAVSGLAGRYFYSRIHYGLYGARATLGELKENLADADHQIGKLIGVLPQLSKEIRAWERSMLQRAQGKYGRIMISSWYTWRSRRRLNRLFLSELSRYAEAHQWDGPKLRKRHKQGDAFIRRYVETVRKVSEITIYEGLFSWWRILHTPFFFMMLISGIVHIFAVHIY